MVAVVADGSVRPEGVLAVGPPPSPHQPLLRVSRPSRRLGVEGGGTPPVQAMCAKLGSLGCPGRRPGHRRAPQRPPSKAPFSRYPLLGLLPTRRGRSLALGGAVGAKVLLAVALSLLVVPVLTWAALADTQRAVGRPPPETGRYASGRRPLHGVPMHVPDRQCSSPPARVIAQDWSFGRDRDAPSVRTGTTADVTSSGSHP